MLYGTLIIPRFEARAFCGVLMFTAAAFSTATGAELVNIKKLDPTIAVELRYAGSNNIAARPLYPSGMTAQLQPGVAEQVVAAHKFLRARQHGLKIWDAYRPPQAQAVLWQLAPNDQYVADPTQGSGSLHSWGVAVDATLVDSFGRDVPMPTDFDDFSPAAMLRYTGNDARVRWNLRLLQIAMARNGFYGLRTEWWHFTTKRWKEYVPWVEAKSNDEPKTPSSSKKPAGN